jgi:hypothetical protein
MLGITVLLKHRHSLYFPSFCIYSSFSFNLSSCILFLSHFPRDLYSESTYSPPPPPEERWGGGYQPFINFYFTEKYEKGEIHVKKKEEK